MVKMKLHQLCTQKGQEQLMQEKQWVSGLEQREPCTQKGQEQLLAPQKKKVTWFEQRELCTQKGQEQLLAPQASLPCLGCE